MYHGSKTIIESQLYLQRKVVRHLKSNDCSPKRQEVNPSKLFRFQVHIFKLCSNFGGGGGGGVDKTNQADVVRQRPESQHFFRNVATDPRLPEMFDLY